MKFSKEFLQEMEGETISDDIVKHTRWSVCHERIFRYKGRFYCTDYSVGATEMQDECPYEYDDDMIECNEVKPVEKTVIVYEAIEN